MRQFKVTCIVGQQDVEPITGLLAQLGGSFHVEELDSHKSNKKSKWYSEAGKALLNGMKAGQEYFYKDASLAAVLKDHDYAATSISAILSHLCEDGKVKRTKRGHYVRV